MAPQILLAVVVVALTTLGQRCEGWTNYHTRGSGRPFHPSLHRARSGPFASHAEPSPPVRGAAWPLLNAKRNKKVEEEVDLDIEDDFEDDILSKYDGNVEIEFEDDMEDELEDEDEVEEEFVRKNFADLDVEEEEEDYDEENNFDPDFEPITDEEILKSVTQAQMQDLCRQLGLAESGTKAAILKRLRKHADEQAKKEEERIAARKDVVEESGTDSKERHEVVDVDETEEDDEPYFYYPEEALASLKSNNQTQASGQPKSNGSVVPENGSSEVKKKKKMVAHTRDSVVSPPPPTEPNEKGERVVTVYSTTDHNDLTGIAASQPQAAIQPDPMKSGVGAAENTPWDIETNFKKRKSPAELEIAREKIVELVSRLLAMSGAPGFQGDGDDDDDDDITDDSELESLGLIRNKARGGSTAGFVGFDPSKVDTATMEDASTALRAGRGRIFDEVLREFELRAIGYDGMNADNVRSGGGHYREVSKVRSFLEGYRRAEVRGYAKETATMLLDKLVTEGVEGLDMALMAMTRSDDDGGFGELNDSLLDFLDDEVRKQEKKVALIVRENKEDPEAATSIISEPSDETAERLWKVEEDKGKRVEVFDAKDPKTKEAIQDAMVESYREPQPVRRAVPKSVPEQLLLVLKLLRDRVKTEAAFPNDEKSRNLRNLSYCINASTKAERKQLIFSEYGKSFDRLDSFIELVSSSIEYGESTSHQLQPTKKGSLNVRLLRQVLMLGKEVRRELKAKATGPSNLAL